MQKSPQTGLGIIIATYLGLGPALAQTSQDWARCLGQDLSTPDLPIQGCTAIIQTGRQVIDRIASAYNNRGVAYRLKAQYDDAIKDFDEALRLRPTFANAFNNRAVAYRNKGDLDHALEDYNEAIRLKPDYVPAFYNRGLVLMDKGEYDRAIDDFAVVLRADPQNPLTLFRRGQTLLKKGNIEAGNADIAAARAIKPDIAEVIARGGG
jgi:tetratricopeptide (TPR) repeat protein